MKGWGLDRGGQISSSDGLQLKSFTQKLELFIIISRKDQEKVFSGSRTAVGKM